MDQEQEGYVIDNVPVTEMTPQQASLEIKKVRADLKNPYHDRSSPLHEDSVKLMSSLYSRVHPDNRDPDTGHNNDAPLDRAAEEGTALREKAVESEWQDAHVLQDKLFALADSLDIQQLYKAIEEHFNELKVGVSARKEIETLMRNGIGLGELDGSAQIDVSDALKKVICEQMLQEWANILNDRRKQNLKMLGKTEPK